MQGKASGVRKYSGYLAIPADGWYAMAIIGKQQVWFGEQALFQLRDQYQQVYVPLKAGLHAYRHVGITDDGYMRFHHDHGWATCPAGRKDR